MDVRTKTLHSRHKSQPALKTALTFNGPQRLGNRKAFGDVSNLAANKILSDEGVAKGKSIGEGDKFPLKDVQEKVAIPTVEVGATKKAPLRSAVSSIALRSNANNLRGLTTRPPPAERVRPELPRPLRKSKTTLFQQKSKPVARQTLIQQDLAVAGELPPNLADEPAPARIVADLPQVQEDIIPEVLEEALTEASQEDLVKEVPPLDLTTAPAVEAIPVLEILSSDLPVVEEAPPSSAGFDDIDRYESALEIIPSSASIEELYLPLDSVAGTEQNAQLQEAIQVEPQAPTSATIPEPEEYWDVEEDDLYPDDGYVTARSFKSVGESQVSGNVTRTLYPHVDQAVRREIAAAKALIESTQDPNEVEDEAWDTSMVQEYSEEIFEYMRELEVRMSPNPHYMDKQTEIQWSMRSVLMDWIVQKIVSLTKLQLVGATAIFVAAKYEEVDCPSVQEINFMVDNGYGVEEILKAERFMLSMLGFELGFPGPMSFLRRISKADDYDLETRTLAKYFLEITIMDERFLTCVPSFTAAGAHCLARMMLRKGNWSPAHVYYSNYTYWQLLPLITLMLECCEDPVGHHNAVYEKYLDRRYKQAAKYVQGELNNGFRIPDENVNVPSMFYLPTQQHYPAEAHQYPTYWPQAV